MAENIDVNIRSRGGRAAARDAETAATGVTRLGKAGTFASARLRELKRSTDLSQNSLYVLRRAGYAAGAGLTAVGVLGVKAGLQFNASMEQNQVAFTQFLGSSRAARAELGFLYKTAANTPFEVPQITSAARQLLAFGFNAKQTNSWLSTIGDTIAGMGGGAEQIDQLVTAIGQIRSKGRLQGDELMQLSELGVVDRGKLAKDLGITSLQLMSGNANISAQKALKALQKQFNGTFGGQSAKQARTFNGQLSTLHDNLNQTLGTLTKPAFNSLEKKWLPALGSSTTAINKIFGRDDIDMAQKITLSRGVLKQKMGPLVDELESQVKAAHLGQKFEAAFEKETPVFLNAAGRLGAQAVEKFAEGWWHAGIWGKLITVAFLGSKMGLFGAAASGAFGWAGRKAAERFRASWRGRIGKLPAPVSVGANAAAGAAEGAAGAAGAGAAAGRGAGAAKWAARGLTLGSGVGIASIAANAAGIEDADPFLAISGGKLTGGDDRPVKQIAAQIRRSHRSHVGRPPAVRDAVSGTQVINLVVDGKTLAKVVNRRNADTKARK